MLAASLERYDRVARGLHWGIGALLLAQIVFGLVLDVYAPRGTPLRAPVINLHKSFGLVLLALVVLRLGWRLAHRPAPSALPARQQRAARLGHRVLYTVMLALPLAGYLASNLGRHGVSFFGQRWAPWGPDLPALYRAFNGLHVGLAWTLCLLIAGHVAAALWHLRTDPPPETPR